MWKHPEKDRGDVSRSVSVEQDRIAEHKQFIVTYRQDEQSPFPLMTGWIMNVEWNCKYPTKDVRNLQNVGNGV